MAGKETKLEEGAISEILAADTDSESDAKASDVDGYFKAEEEEEQQQQQQLQTSAEVEPKAATSGWLPTWELPQGRNTNIHPSVDPAGPAKGGPWNCFSTFWI